MSDAAHNPDPHGVPQRPRRRVRFGIQTPLQHTTPSELIALWQRAEAAGFDLISVWDHLQPVAGPGPSLEAISMHAALATVTHRVRCACLVYDVAMRPLGVLAQAIATIDHLSGGRAVLGLGAGYLQREHDAFGIPLGSPRERSDRLHDSVEALVALLHDRTSVTVDTPLLRLDDARCEPGPLQEHLPLWIGGGGERRTIPLAGRLADGWNIPMAAAHDVAAKIALLRHVTAEAGRPADAVEASVNVGLSFDADLIPERYGARWPVLRPAILSGSPQEMIEQVHRYVAAGVDWLVLSLRTPFDADELDRFASEIAPEFQ